MTEREFWQKVYISAIHAGHDAAKACTMANEAVRYLSIYQQELWQMIKSITVGSYIVPHHWSKVASPGEFIEMEDGSIWFHPYNGLLPFILPQVFEA